MALGHHQLARRQRMSTPYIQSVHFCNKSLKCVGSYISCRFDLPYADGISSYDYAPKHDIRGVLNIMTANFLQHCRPGLECVNNIWGNSSTTKYLS